MLPVINNLLLVININNLIYETEVFVLLKKWYILFKEVKELCIEIYAQKKVYKIVVRKLDNLIFDIFDRLNI